MPNHDSQLLPFPYKVENTLFRDSMNMMRDWDAAKMAYIENNN